MKSAKLLIRIGSGLIILSLVLFVLIFYPVIFQELKFLINRPDKNLTSQTAQEQKEIILADTEFGIMIPKIGANAKVIADVDPYNSKVYQQALTKGVAHALGTPYPGLDGNTFLFAHSSGNFYEANRFNSIFYLLYKIENDDEIILYYKGEKFTYKVIEKRVVDASQVEYIQGTPDKKTVTLMTCWPAGTTYKRLVVVAEDTSNEK